MMPLKNTPRETQSSEYDYEASRIGGTIAGLTTGAVSMFFLPSLLRAKLTGDQDSFFAERTDAQIRCAGGDPDWDVQYDSAERSAQPAGRFLTGLALVACVADQTFGSGQAGDLTAYICAAMAASTSANALYEAHRVASTMRYRSLR